MHISHRMILAGLAAACVTSLVHHRAYAVGFEILRPHRAVYDLKLKEASDRSGIEAMNGRIAYEMTGNECDGISVRYRFVTNITTAETAYQTDQRTATYESADGNEFNFTTSTFVDQRPERTVRGTATRSDGVVTVELREPEEKTAEFDDAVFISTQLVKLLEAASAGKRFMRRDVFDGSGDADDTVRTSAVIGAQEKDVSAREGEDADGVAALADTRAWPVTVSYFEQQVSASGELLPVYEASFLLHDNGVSRSLVMRYPDYSLAGTLSSLEMLENTPCTQAQ